MRVPFNDLARQYDSLKNEIDRTLSSTLQQFNFVRGTPVAAFEKAFARAVGTSSCIATGNGTDSLFLILKALGIKAGDEVITPSFSWISSAEVISLSGARPVFSDVDDLYFTLDPEKIESKITAATKAIVAVHLYGQAAAMDDIKAICKKHNLFLVEDCAQAHLTRLGKYPTGTFGDAAAFSFYPTKNLGAYGDAGCVVTNDDALAVKIRRLANHGALQKDDHEMEGINSRMDSLQAAVLATKLPHLERWNHLRRKNAQIYSTELKDILRLKLPSIRQGSEHSFHLYVIRTPARNDLQRFLAGRDIQTLIHYPCALPNLSAYRYLKKTPRDFPVATALQDEVLSLPVHPELTGEQIQYVCENIREFFGK